MTEIIESINDNFSGWHKTVYGDSRYSGVKIITNTQEILLLIDDSDRCCEHWGHLSSHDDAKEFIGAELLSIIETDSELHTKEIKEMEDMNISIDCAYFITLKTSKGDLQFTIYNEHNGYYGHDVVIKSTQLTRNFSL